MKAFRAIIRVLTVATLIQAVAMAFMGGYEVGRNSQNGRLMELYMKAYPDEGCYLIEFNRDRHPLSSILDKTFVLLLTCWMLVISYVVVKKLQTIAQTERTPQATSSSM
jgi:hypothetical protein